MSAASVVSNHPVQGAWPEFANVTIRYGTLFGIAAGSGYFLGQSSLGRFAIFLLSSSTVGGAGVYAFLSARAIWNGGGGPLIKLSPEQIE